MNRKHDGPLSSFAINCNVRHYDVDIRFLDSKTGEPVEGRTKPKMITRWGAAASPCFDRALTPLGFNA